MPHAASCFKLACVQNEKIVVFTYFIREKKPQIQYSKFNRL